MSDKDRLIAALEKIHLDLNDGKVEEAHDAVLDLLDVLTGWCHPNARISNE